MSTQLEGKSVLVTGASRGIGAAAAVGLAQAGAMEVVLHYNAYQAGAEETAERVRAAGAKVNLVQADLGHIEGIHKLIDEVKSHAFDILINNAGHLVKRAKLLESTEDIYDSVMNLNVKSMWFITRAVVSSMIEKKSGVIVNVGSIAARNGGGPGATMYAAAKAAVATFTKGWAKELAPHGIRVNAVSPGTVDNYFHEKHSNRQILDSVIAATPAGRLATNEDVSDVILFLCSDASRYVHGQTIEVNGGMYMI
jgi:NAD(P)-dependent dehydrogenase (short-subunit alcohol dehydrogenase family)